MGRTEKRELVSRLKVLLMQLLKWRFQPTGRGTSWRLTIEEQRREVIEHMADNPSLKSKVVEALANAHVTAVLAAARETGLDRRTFPVDCPWSYEQIVDETFWPEEG
jgi:CTP:molybdopterin cytidylyltransferase MocA